MSFTVEIVTHCYSGPGEQYAHLLAYQLSSILRHPPQRAVVDVFVVYSMEDWATRLTLWYGGVPHSGETFRRHDRHWLWPWPMPLPELFNRPIGRNQRALATRADVIFFTDCDYCFGPGCLDALEQIADRPEPLFFPRETLINRDHATGDRYIDAARQQPYKANPYMVGDWTLPLDPADFVARTEHRAIGGIQIVPGDVARRVGYCPGGKWQRPAPEGTDTIIGFGADAAFRRQLGTPGTPIEVPNLYRLRHSQTGDERAKRKGLVA